LKGKPYRTEVFIGSHTLITDEPLDKGGMNDGPEAHSILLAALVACTSITVKMYIDRKGWDVGEIAIDCSMTRTIEKGEQHTFAIQNISFTKDIDEATKNRILAISKKCPVHKTLSPAISIETNIL